MVRIIPRDKIRHLEWHPGQEVPLGPNFVRGRTLQPAGGAGFPFTIDDILKGKPFFSDKKDEADKYIGVAVALKEALEYAAAHDGNVASLPYLIAGKAKAGKKNYLWKDWHTALTEENIGIDKKGLFVGAGKPVVVVVHGGGILTPDRIFKAYEEGLTAQNAAKYTDEEFDGLLDGTLPSGESLALYSLDDIKNAKIPDPFARYGIVLDFETAKSRQSGYHLKPDFMSNELVIARAGTLDHLDDYFEKAKNTDRKVGNLHRLAEIDYNQQQGRVLFLDLIINGLIGNLNLDNLGRFVVVEAPEAHGAKK